MAVTLKDIIKLTKELPEECSMKHLKNSKKSKKRQNEGKKLPLILACIVL